MDAPDVPTRMKDNMIANFEAVTSCQFYAAYP